MAVSSFDVYNHASVAPGTAYATGATGTTVAGTIVPVAAGAGTGSSVALITGINCNDTRGTFSLVTAGSPAAGAVCSVFFTNPYAAIPGAVQVQAFDTSGTPVGILVGASSVTQTGFSVVAGALTTAHTITITYEVIA